MINLEKRELAYWWAEGEKIHQEIFRLADHPSTQTAAAIAACRDRMGRVSRNLERATREELRRAFIQKWGEI